MFHNVNMCDGINILHIERSSLMFPEEDSKNKFLEFALLYWVFPFILWKNEQLQIRYSRNTTISANSEMNSCVVILFTTNGEGPHGNGITRLMNEFRRLKFFEKGLIGITSVVLMLVKNVLQLLVNVLFPQFCILIFVRLVRT